MAGTEPRILAAYLQANLASLEARPKLSKRIESRLGARSVRSIQAARRSQWLPWSILVRASEAVFSECESEHEARGVVRDAVGLALDDPLLRPLVRGVGWLGRDPRRLARWVPTAWKAVARDAGRVRWTALGRRQGLLRWEDAPRESRESLPYLKALEASLGCLFDLAETPGTAVSRIEREAVTIRLDW